MGELVTSDKWGTARSSPAAFGDRYDVAEKVGDGGMATVYRATDRTLKRDVAIKVMHPHLSKRDDARARFAREAKAAARLKHANIVDVYDYSSGQDSEAFLVTEFVHGETLTQFGNDHGPFLPQAAALIAHAVAGALGHAHAAGIVHRDIKPDNLMISRDGQIKLMDFGIATAVDLEQMTITGAIVGSPAHMAPEQIEGGELDARCDMFALGTVIYFLVTRRLPFQASNPHALFRQILEGQYEPASRFNPAVDRTFDGIIAQCLQRKPVDRFANMAALQTALHAYCRQFRMSDVAGLLQRFLRGPELFQHDLKPDLVASWTQEGRRLAADGHLALAIDAFNRALVIDPEAEQPRAGLAWLTQRSRRRRQWKRAGLAAATAVGAAGLAWAGMQAIAWLGRSDPLPTPARAVNPFVPAGPDPTLIARGEAFRRLGEEELALRKRLDAERALVAQQVAPLPMPVTTELMRPETLLNSAKAEENRTKSRDSTSGSRAEPGRKTEPGNIVKLPSARTATHGALPAGPGAAGGAAVLVPVRIGSLDTTATLQIDGEALGEGSAKKMLEAGRTYVVRCVPQAACVGCRPGTIRFVVPHTLPDGMKTWIAPKCAVGPSSAP
jgi:tRNA A-37 threonylcarbamoyl transferase component Bud32/tetratricopeptide (TPR) repeat protein